MLCSILVMGAILMATGSSVNAVCSKGCVCPATSPIVECNTINFEPFGMHVFSLKISHTTEPLVLNEQVFNVKGLENINTISIENATISNIEESAFNGLPLLSTLIINNCSIPIMNNSTVFINASSLRTLRISDSNLSSFENVKSEHLEELVLTGNKLKVISKEYFSELPSLITIRLSDNAISEIDPLAFSKLPYLQEVGLANNNLSNLHYDMFKSNVELVTLDLSNNPITKFNINITLDLEKLVLKSCQLEEIDEKVSLNLDYLSYLDLSDNKITLSKTIFNKMKELDCIDLSKNSLKTLDSHIFRTNYKLQKIILDNNNFTVLPKLLCSGGNFETYFFSCNNCNISTILLETFKQFPALTTLNLSNNHITSANLSAFHHLRSLIELDLSYNKITSLSTDAFNKASALEKLNLAGNQISNIDPTIFKSNRVLKTLDFSGCALHQLWNNPEKNALTSVRQLILSNNHISMITLADLGVISAVEVFDVSNNPLKCDKSLKEIITWLNEHEVSPVIFNTHEELNTVDAVIFEGAVTHWSWKQLAKEKCPENYYLENFKEKPIEYDYTVNEFDSDEEPAISEEIDGKDQFGKDIVGMKISEILSSSRNKENTQYSFLWPTLVFIFTSLSVLVIAANIMLLMLRSSRKRNIPHIRIPQWNTQTKLKKHSGSIYRPLSEEKFDSCVSIADTKEHVPTHSIINNSIP